MTLVRPEPVADLAAALERATSRIAPTWPLDRAIAVNPLWGFVEEPFPAVSARVASLTGARLVPSRAWLRARAANLPVAHVRDALDELGLTLDPEEVRAALAREPSEPHPREKVADLVGGGPVASGLSWSRFVVHDLAQHCAAWFDDGFAGRGQPPSTGLYASWRAITAWDPLVPRHRLRSLPDDPRQLVASTLPALAIPADQREAYLVSLLFDVGGWAAWCAYLRWTARQRGADDDHLVELLAARLAWERILYDEGGPELHERWASAREDWPERDRAEAAAQEIDQVVLRALELARDEALARGLRSARSDRARPSIQAVFCIDVRSEPYRRALEAEGPEVETLGFAGFFGLPIEYRPVGALWGHPRLPGLLAPRLRATDGVDEALGERRRRRLDLRAAWKWLQQGAVSGFAAVEATGLLLAPKLLADALGFSRPAAPPDRAGLTVAEHRRRRPRITELASGRPIPISERIDLAAGLLRGMGLTTGRARLVALIGHASRSVNNPHAATLDCGACCGRSGEANARAAAALLNDPEVREGLRSLGLDPSPTWFVPGLHETTTEEVELLDTGEVPPSHRAELELLRARLDRASERTRRERAPRLGLARLDEVSLGRALEARARDWAQVRPEWGLAGNTALVIAPRERTRHLDLGGRVFLHEYRWREDPDLGGLASLLTAPMVVAHWINLQYYASSVAPQRFGSGNKVLHDVVGGGIGVLEGNGGDLRIGLPLQSVHDGRDLVHEPLRLGVFVEAPREAIEAILRAHDLVRQLAENGWVHLHRIGEDGVEAWRRGRWAAVA